MNMTAREKILADVRRNQPPLVAAPDIALWEDKIGTDASPILETFKTVAGNVGSRVVLVNSIEDIKTHLDIAQGARVLTTIPQLFDIADNASAFANATPHGLENVELAILKTEFGVAENSALWVTEEQMGVRVLPFICQHLAFVVNASDIV
ncbi:MAG: lactate utilization protein B/C, partial [Sphingobacteriales bacterium]